MKKILLFIILASTIYAAVNDPFWSMGGPGLYSSSGSDITVYWSMGGPQVWHQYSGGAPPTAYYDTLWAIAGTGGTVSPASKYDTCTATFRDTATASTGYVFVKWTRRHNHAVPADSTNHFGVWTFNTSSSLSDTIDAVFAATYTVTYNGNGNTGGTAPTDGNYYTNGATVTTLTNSGSLTKTGYTFSTWNTQADGNGTNRTPSGTWAIGAANVALYAKWMVNTYHITFDKNNSSATGSMSDENYDYGTTAALTSNGFSLTGYTFAGWATSAGGSVIYADAASYGPMGAGNVTLYAQWTINTYHITFDKNNAGATGSMSNENYDYGTTANLTANGYSLTGYAFAGWATSSGGAVVYANQESYGPMGAGNVTLYAQWTLNTYTLTMAAAHGTTTPSVGGHTVGPGVSTAISHTPASGWGFHDWGVSGGATLGSAATINSNTAILTSNGTVTANDTAIPVYVTITSSAGTGGTVAPLGAIVVQALHDTSITATAAMGYRFAAWTGSANVTIATSTTATTIFSKADSTDGTIAASFSRVTYTMTNANDGHGTFTPVTGPQDSGASFNLVSISATGYRFWKYTRSGIQVVIADSALASTNAYLKAAGTITLYDSIIHYQLTNTNDGHGTFTPASGLHDTAVSFGLAATASSGYIFLKWTRSSTNVIISDSTDPNATAYLKAAGTISATFRAIPISKSFETWIQLSPNVSIPSSNFSNPSQRIASGMCVHKGKIIIAGGHSIQGNEHDVYSFDGRVMHQMTAAAGWSIRIINNALLSVRDTLWVMGGGYDQDHCYNDIWYSVDTGATWTQGALHATWAARLNHTVNYDSATQRFIVCGGSSSEKAFMSDVWYATNPRGTWTQATSFAAFDSVEDHSAIILNGKIYVMGGFVQPGYFTNNIFTSACSDLTTWTQVSVTGDQWSDRCCAAVTSIGNSIYMIAGFEGGGIASNDFWRSDDSCKTWKLEAANCPWPLRDSPSAVSWAGKIYLFGGYKWDDLTRLNDLWVTFPLKPTYTATTVSGYKKSICLTLATKHAIQDFVSAIKMDSLPATFWTTANKNLTDIHVTDAANNSLDREIQNYDSAGHHGYLWVRSNIYSDSTKIKIHYGNVSATDSNAHSTWTTSNNFEAMYHFTEPTGVYKSSANSHDGTVSGSVSRNVDSLISPCVSFNGSSGIITIGDIPTQYKQLVRYSGIYRFRSNNTLNAFAQTSEAGFYYEFETDYFWHLGPGSFKLKTKVFPTNTDKVKFDLVFDARNYGNSNVFIAYVNGIRVPDSLVVSDGPNYTTYGNFGAGFILSKTGRVFNGQMDEIGISINSPFTVDTSWIAEEELFKENPFTYTVGSEQTAPSGGGFRRRGGFWNGFLNVFWW